jgi:hypothetical protein
MRALIALSILMSACGIFASVWIGDIPRRQQKFQDRLVFERGTVIEHEGRKFVTQRLRDK